MRALKSKSSKKQLLNPLELDEKGANEASLALFLLKTCDWFLKLLKRIIQRELTRHLCNNHSLWDEADDDELDDECDSKQALNLGITCMDLRW